MPRPVVALITLNGQSSIGPRYVAAACRAAGIETHLIHLKLFRSREVTREESKRLAAQYPHGFVVRVHPKGDELIPYPNEITEQEMGILIDYLQGAGATLVGVSFTSVDLRKAIEVTDAVHRRLPGVPVAWGGVHAILNPESSILHADMVCTGEGDEVLVAHLKDPSRRDLPGLWFRDGERITRNPQRPLIRDLDSLPFPVYGGEEVCIENDQLDTTTRDVSHSMERHYQIVTARGCPFACNYCLHSKIRRLYSGQGYLRRRSVENVMRELETRVNQGFVNGWIPFFDEVFISGPRWIEEFVPRYGRSINLPFTGYAHEALTSPDMLKSLHDVGLVGITLGFQSGSERLCREVYNRVNNLDRLVALSQAVHDMRLIQLPVYEGLTNTPFETEDDCRATLDFLLRLPTPFYLQMFRLEIFPGTEIEKIPPLPQPLSEDMFRFWNMLYQMTQSPRLPRRTIRALADDPVLRADPQWIEDLTEALFPGDPLLELADRIRAGTRATQEERFARREAQAHAGNGGLAARARSKLRRLLRRN